MKHEIHNLAGYLEGALPEAARARVERHLEGCAHCRAALAEMRAAGRALRGLAEAAPIPAYDTELWRRVRAQIAPAPRRAPLRPRWALATGGMGLVAGALALTLVLSHPENPLQIGKPEIPKPPATDAAKTSRPTSRPAATPRPPAGTAANTLRPAAPAPPAGEPGVPTQPPPASMEVQPARPAVPAMADDSAARRLIPGAVESGGAPAASLSRDDKDAHRAATPPALTLDSSPAPVAARAASPLSAVLEKGRTTNGAPPPAAPGTAFYTFRQGDEPAGGLGPAGSSGRGGAGEVRGPVPSAGATAGTTMTRLAAPPKPDASVVKTEAAEPPPEIVSDRPPSVDSLRMAAPAGEPAAPRPRAAGKETPRLRVVVSQKALLDRGEAANGKGDVSAARTAFGAVLQNSPIPSEARQAHIGLGDAALKANDNTVAVKEYRAAADIARDADLLVKLGNAYERAGQAKEAREAYRQALILNASCDEAKIGLSRLGAEDKDTKRR